MDSRSKGAEVGYLGLLFGSQWSGAGWFVCLFRVSAGSPAVTSLGIWHTGYSGSGAGVSISASGSYAISRVPIL